VCRSCQNEKKYLAKTGSNNHSNEAGILDYIWITALALFEQQN
jgi:hypothetical protein